MTLPRRIFLVCLALVLACQAARAADDVPARRSALYAAYAQQLAELAQSCADQGLDDAAAELKGWLPPRDPDKLTLFVLPRATPTAERNASPTPPWRERWQALRNEQAEALFALARQAVDEHRPSLVYELVTEAVRENPDHQEGRELLGYVRLGDQWCSPFEVRQTSAGKVWHDKYGWLPAAHVARYEAGERQYQGRWMAADEEERLRGELNRGWRVESTHYVVTTNHSLEEGVRLSNKLERLYDVWQQAFAAYLADEAEMKRRLNGRLPRARPRQHQVFYYRTRDEYNNALRPLQPKIDITLGIYLDKTHVAHFYAGDEQHPGTLYHEAAHQLFQESRRTSNNVGRGNNFWIVEGIACYMESLADHGHYVTLGGANAGRMPAARHRLLTDHFYVPLAELVELGMEPLQNDSRIARIYSQSSGLADFLMHDGEGRYREALTKYLLEIYTGRPTSRTLADLAGADYATLDRQYREFMMQSPPAEPDAATAPLSAAR